MCPPAVIAAGAAVASAVVGAGAAIYGGIQQSKARKYQAAVDEQNAGLAAREAADAQERGAKTEAEHYRKLSQLRGSQIAALAANGLDVSFGSALDVQTDTAIFGNADGETIRENTLREVDGYRISAANYRASAGANRRATRSALIAGGLDAGSTLLTSASQIAGASGKYGSSRLAKAGASLSVRNSALDAGFSKAAYAKPF